MKKWLLLIVPSLLLAPVIAYALPFSVQWQGYTDTKNGVYTAADYEVSTECAIAGGPFREVSRVQMPATTTGELNPPDAVYDAEIQCRARAYYKPGQEYSPYSAVVSGKFPAAPRVSPSEPTGLQLIISATGQGITFGRIQAEDYVAYHDTDAVNVYHEYREDGVDVRATTDEGGGYNVESIKVGEWLEYDFAALAAGQYVVELRTARASTGTSRIDITVDGGAPTSVEAPSTGAWQTFTTIRTTPIQIAAGAHKIRLTFLTGAVNVNWLNIVAVQ